MRARPVADGVLLLNSCGTAAGQVVMHFHVHVVPIEGELPPLPRPAGLADEADLESVAAALRARA